MRPRRFAFATCATEGIWSARVDGMTWADGGVGPRIAATFRLTGSTTSVIALGISNSRPGSDPRLLLTGKPSKKSAREAALTAAGRAVSSSGEHRLEGQAAAPSTPGREGRRRCAEGDGDHDTGLAGISSSAGIIFGVSGMVSRGTGDAGCEDSVSLSACNEEAACKERVSRSTRECGPDCLACRALRSSSTADGMLRKPPADQASRPSSNFFWSDGI